MVSANSNSMTQKKEAKHYAKMWKYLLKYLVVDNTFSICWNYWEVMNKSC